MSAVAPILRTCLAKLSRTLSCTRCSPRLFLAYQGFSPSFVLEHAAFACKGFFGPQSQPSPGRCFPNIVWHPLCWRGSSPAGWLAGWLPPSLPPSLPLSGILARVVCFLVCSRADCALFVVLTVRASPAWHTDARQARKRARRRLHRTGTVATARDLAACRRSRRSTSESGMDLCVLPHGKCGLQTQVQQLREQLPRWSARGLGRETREGQEKRQVAPSQACVALRRLWRGQLFAAMVLLLVWSEASRVGSIFSSGATQETTRLTAVELCRGCGSGTSQGRRPTARRPMSRSTRIRARTKTRAAAKRLPTSSRT